MKLEKGSVTKNSKVQSKNKKNSVSFSANLLKEFVKNSNFKEFFKVAYLIKRTAASNLKTIRSDEIFPN